MNQLTIGMAIFFLLINALIANSAVSPDRTEYMQAIKEARMDIWKELSTNNGSSATVAIMDDGQIVYSEQFGMRSREKSLPVDRETQFNIGSISKIFTAAAMLHLVDQGKVELDAPVTKYLANFRMADKRYQDITVRMLLNHTSGLPGSNMRNAFGSRENPNYIDETLAYLAGNRLKHEPGLVSVYCNDGLTVAEAVIEQVSGMSYAKYLRQQIYEPLRMGQSSCSFKAGNENIAQVYEQTGLPMPPEYVSALATGGISATAEDLCRFSTVLYSNKLLSTASIEEFSKAQYGLETAVGERTFLNFGLGWDSVQMRKFAEQGITALGKSGGTTAFSSHILVVPEEKLTVALLFAGAGIDATSVTEKVMQALLEGKKKVTEKKMIFLPPGRAVIPSSILALAGIYASSNAIMKLNFDLDSNMLETSSWDGEQFVPADSSQYKEDGYFHSENGNKYWLKPYGELNYLLLAVGENYVSHIVTAESIAKSDSSWTGSAFARKLWVFRNATNYDFIEDLAETGQIPELPGYIFFDGNNMMLLKLESESSAGMSMQYARDLFAIQLEEAGGEQWLKTGNFIYSEADKVSSLPIAGETVSLGTAGLNEWRKTDKQAIFSCAIPSDGRVMIFSQDKQPIFDSLESTAMPIVVGGGSFISFIGTAGDDFVVTLTY
ncbi:MAG: beta-lactamase family protein [Proteobacteria bacterium]|nr:beta-lactamase family protein [Pseudomonadota bacterium]